MIATIRRLIKTYTSSFLVYLVVGGVSALVEWGVFFFLTRASADRYIGASVVAFVVATGINFLLSRRIGFRSGGRSPLVEMALVYLASLAGFGINLLVMVTLVEGFGGGLLVGKIAGTGVAFGWNFVARQFLIFSRTPRWGGSRAAQGGSTMPPRIDPEDGDARPAGSAAA